MQRNLIITVVVAVILAGFVLAYTRLVPAVEQPTMGGMAASGPSVPPVKGYSEGMEIRFIHTEASEQQVAKMLTDMMGSPVLVVPALAQAPEGMLANVYAFTNGIKDGGPLGFQPDVFDNPPGTAGYSPLRSLNLVTWKNESASRELKSAEEVKEAESKGELSIKRPGVVVNMPLLTWPGGKR
ncbi:MAG: hypothetical protein HY326_08960 [Chloroflexi bacterium]|nr:hypothetical protein [Chloroflexota bacterium]